MICHNVYRVSQNHGLKLLWPPTALRKKVPWSLDWTQVPIFTTWNCPHWSHIIHFTQINTTFGWKSARVFYFLIDLFLYIWFFSFDSETNWISGTFQFLHESTYSLEMCRDLHILKQYSDSQSENEDNSKIDPEMSNIEEFVSYDQASIDWNTQVI